MNQKNKEENAIVRNWEKPVNLPDPRPGHGDSAASAGSSVHPPADQDGTAGFNPQLSGHAKAHHSHTTGFALPQDYMLVSPAGEKMAGQEEGGRARQPATSSVGRLKKTD